MRQKDKTLAAQVAEIHDYDRKQEVRAVAIDALLGEYQEASPKYQRFIVNQLDKLGYDRDYLGTDSGNDYTDYYNNPQ